MFDTLIPPLHRRYATARGFIVAAIPDWALGTAGLVGVYVAFMLVLTLWMPVWHQVDLAFFQRITVAQDSTISSDIAIVDVRSWDTIDIPADRRTIAAFLEQLVKNRQHPIAVVLDISFGPCQSKPCDPNWTAARASLIKALAGARAAGVDVYATEEVPVDESDDVLAAPSPRDESIYAQLTAAGHTGFTIVPGSRFLFYRVCYAPANGLDHDLWSVATRILPSFDASRGCDTEHRPVLVGPPIGAGSATLYHIAAQRPFPAEADFQGKYVILGTTQYDRPRYSDRSGPELLAWALTDALARQQSMVSLQGYYEAKPQNGMLLALIPLFSAVTILAFTTFYFLARRLRLKNVRRFLPWISATVAVCTGLLVFAAFEYWMFLSHEIQPQVTLISIGMLAAAVLCGVRARQIEFVDSSTIEIQPTEKHDYDVFISYAHDEGAWVFEHVYAPLRDAKRPDGTSLSIFFDTSSIRVGTAWQDKISLAIDGSRFIVPVYSAIYFTKPYCRFEIRRAHRKWIGAGDQSRCVLPVMRGHPQILQTVDDIQATSIDDDPNIVKNIIEEITARLGSRAQK